MSVCFRLFVVVPFVRGGAEAATELGPQRREQSGWSGESVEGPREGGAPRRCGSGVFCASSLCRGL